MPGPLPAGRYHLVVTGASPDHTSQLVATVIVRSAGQADRTMASTMSTVPPGGEQAGGIDAMLDGAATDARCGDQLVLKLENRAGGSFLFLDSALDLP